MLQSILLPMAISLEKQIQLLQRLHHVSVASHKDPTNRSLTLHLSRVEQAIMDKNLPEQAVVHAIAKDNPLKEQKTGKIRPIVFEWVHAVFNDEDSV